MKKRTYLLLSSPLFLAMTCYNLGSHWAKTAQVTSELQQVDSTPYLYIVANFDEYLLDKRRIDSVQFIFWDQTGKPIGTMSKEIHKPDSSLNYKLTGQFPLDDFHNHDTLVVYVKAKLFKRAKFRETVELAIAEYDLSSYK